MPTLRMGAAEWAMLLLLSILWGGSFFFVEVILTELPPLVLVAARVGLAALALWVVVLALRLPVPRDAKTWKDLFVMGALNNVLPFGLLAWGQSYVTGGLAAVLNATAPLWAVLFANLLTRDEKATPAKVTGVLVGMLGVAAIMGPAMLGDADARDFPILPALACIAAAVSYGYTGVFGRRFAPLPPMVVAAGQLTCSTIIVTPLALVVSPLGTIPVPSAGVVASVMALALLSSALAYVLFFRILRAAGATNVLLVTQLVPVTAILLGAIFLGERLDLRVFAGMALIAIGLAVVDGRVLDFFRRRRTQA